MVLSVQRISPFRVCNRPLRHALGLSFQFAETKWLLCFYFFILELVYLVINRNRNFLDRVGRAAKQATGASREVGKVQATKGLLKMQGQKLSNLMYSREGIKKR